MTVRIHLPNKNEAPPIQLTCSIFHEQVDNDIAKRKREKQLSRNDKIPEWTGDR